MALGFYFTPSSGPFTINVPPFRLPIRLMSNFTLCSRPMSAARGCSTLAPRAANCDISSYVIRWIGRAPGTSLGSAVMMPEVFLKALSLVRNLGHDADSFTAAKYDEAISQLEAAGAGAPAGRLYHVALETDGQIQVFDVWDSQESFDAFGETLVPIMTALGVDPGQPMVSKVHNLIQG